MQTIISLEYPHSVFGVDEDGQFSRATQTQEGAWIFTSRLHGDVKDQVSEPVTMPYKDAIGHVLLHLGHIENV